MFHVEHFDTGRMRLYYYPDTPHKGEREMISKQVARDMAGGSMIRKMFEEGARLKKIYGNENVFDFSIGNPDAEPPNEVIRALKELIDVPGIHKYMPNAGYEDVRKAVAAKEGAKAGLPMVASHVVMTAGAAGGLNVALAALLDPGDEVIVLAPYFVEYLIYVRNHSGVPVIVKCDAETFQPDIEAIAAAVTEKTKAVLLNSPNNPTGAVYGEAALKELSAALLEAGGKYGRDIYVLSDEPYAQLLYDGRLPSTLSLFANGLVVNSFSKSLSLPGERIGYVAVSPNAADCERLLAALVFSNRTLGYVNAPSLFQKVVAASLDAGIDISEYKARRDMLYGCITSLGLKCLLPAGAFYLFPEAPGGDDIGFAARAAEQRILIVPGSGFGWPGHVRIAYCTGRDTISRSFSAWERLLKGN
jgi:aspartate aminotransferase